MQTLYTKTKYITYKHWWNFEANYEEDREKGREKTVVCTNLKQTSTKCGAAFGDV